MALQVLLTIGQEVVWTRTPRLPSCHCADSPIQMTSTALDGSSHISDILAMLSNSRRNWRHFVCLSYIFRLRSCWLFHTGAEQQRNTIFSETYNVTKCSRMADEARVLSIMWTHTARMPGRHGDVFKWTDSRESWESQEESFYRYICLLWPCAPVWHNHDILHKLLPLALCQNRSLKEW